MAYRDSNWNIVSWKAKKVSIKKNVKKTNEGMIVWWIADNLSLLVWKIKEEGELSSIIKLREWWWEVVVPNNKIREGNDDDYFE